jgi:uncharacterized protein YyaL (SSP411 family)
LLGELPYLDAAERTLRAGWPMLREYPQAHMTLVNALDDYLAAGDIVILRGDADQAAQWRAEVTRSYAPSRMVFAISRDAPDLPAALAAKRPMDGTVAYVCSGMTCSAPLTELREIAAAITAAPP